MCSQKILEELFHSIRINEIDMVRDLLSKNPEIFQPQTNNSYDVDDSSQILQLTPLWESMLCGLDEIVELLIDFGADPNELFLFEKNKFYGLTFLQCLAMQGHFWQGSQKVAEALIRRKANLNSFPDSNKTPLQIAADYGNAQYAEFLRNNGAKAKNKMKDNIDNDEISETTTLWDAMFSGDEETIKLLIGFGADPDEPFSSKRSEYYGLTFLQCLAMQDYFWRCNQKVAEILICCIKKSKTRLSRERSSLIMSIKQGNTQYAEFLLNNRMKVKISLRNIFTAPKNKQKKIIELLIEQNLLTEFHNKLGSNFLRASILCAIKFPKLDIDFIGITKTFLKYGVLFDDLDSNGESILHHAIRLQNIELISFFIEKGFDVNLKSEMSGFFPLYLSAHFNNVNLIDVLLLNGADINDKTGKGNTAMHIACYKRNDKNIDLLMQKGAKISVENTQGYTPFSLLNPYEYKEIDVSCINLFIKEFAKKIFLNDQNVCKKDLELVQSYPILKEYFQVCSTELSQMSSTKFYPPYSYGIALKMSRNIKKLANLAKNEEFVLKYDINLKTLSFYETDLRRILDEAMQVRDKSLYVESSLRFMFGNFLPYVVLRKLESYLSIKDLPLQNSISEDL